MEGWIGLDVGGANLKAADGAGRAISTAFALWREPERLPERLRSLLNEFPPAERRGVAMTMTGELADCFATKTEGVRSIVEATVSAAGEAAVRVATVDDRWLLAEEAIASPRSVAAANWRVAARLVARLLPSGNGIGVDVGSTTVDVIPIAGGTVTSRGTSDTERLVLAELVYTGVRRTPVCAIVDRLPYRGADCPVASEVFATAADAWLLAGELDEDPADNATADGRPLVRSASIDRLARCVCADRDTFDAADAIAAAEAIVAQQTNAIASAIDQRTSDWTAISGEGDFLARRAITASRFGGRVVALRETLGEAVSRCLPAHAAARLASTEVGPVW